MISIEQLLLFSLASIVLILTPGPDNIYVMTRGIAQGKKAALAAALGFSLGNIFHTTFAVVGLSALLVASAQAFFAVKIVGAAYLVYLGIKMFRDKSLINTEEKGNNKSAFRIFRESIIANILNPKVAVFFLAFFPQFVKNENGSQQLQMIVLGFTFVLLTMIGFSLIGLAASSIGRLLKKNDKIQKYLGKGAGVILVSLGISLACSEA